MSELCIQSVEVIDEPDPIVAVVVLDPEHSPLRFTAVAAAILSSNCLVHVRADGLLIRADAELGLEAHGLVRASAVQGQLCEVETGGTWPGFSGRSPGVAQWLGTAGQMTETPDESGLVQEVGRAVSSSKISVQILPAFELA